MPRVRVTNRDRYGWGHISLALEVVVSVQHARGERHPLLLRSVRSTRTPASLIPSSAVCMSPRTSPRLGWHTYQPPQPPHSRLGPPPRHVWGSSTAECTRLSVALRQKAMEAQRSDALSLSGLDDDKHLFRERALLALGRALEAGESSAASHASNSTSGRHEPRALDGVTIASTDATRIQSTRSNSAWGIGVGSCACGSRAVGVAEQQPVAHACTCHDVLACRGGTPAAYLLLLGFGLKPPGQRPVRW